MKRESLEQLVTRTMPFGKYKGRVLADLPGNYLNWLARKGFPPGELGRLLALMHEIDHNGLSSLLGPLRHDGRFVERNAGAAGKSTAQNGKSPALAEGGAPVRCLKR